VDSIAWLADGRTLAVSGGDDKQGGDNWMVRLWDTSASPPVEISSLNAGTPLAISPDGKTMATAWATEVRLWTLPATDKTKPATMHGHSGSINALSFSPDGKLLVSAGKDKKVLVWDVAETDVRAHGEAHNDQVVHVAWAPNGQMFATGGESPGRVILWDVTGKKLKEWLLFGNDIYASHVAFSPDSTRLAFPANLESGPAVCIIRVDAN
jgi:WD40 repeat protein